MDRFPGYLVVGGSIAIAGGAIGTGDLAPLAFLVGVVVAGLGVALGLGLIRGFTSGR
ncbi:MAG: hypothetical protein R3C39_01685 [Dehalococcoidia bacterium]